MLGASCQGIGRIEQRREVQVGRHFFNGWRDIRLPWIRVCHQVSILEFLILFRNFLLLLLQELLEFLAVLVNCVGEVGEIVRKQVGIGQTHDCRSYGLRKGAAIAEIGIGEVGIPVVVVVDGVVNAAVIFSAVAETQGGDTQVINENRVIGSRTKRGNSQIFTLTNFFAIVIGLALDDVIGTSSLPNADLLFWVLNIFGDSVNEFFQRVRSVCF